MSNRIRQSVFPSLVLSLMLAGCAGGPTDVPTVRVFTLIGTLGLERYTSADVPGSTDTRPGTTLPAFLVCETDDATPDVRAAAIVDRATLTLRADGTAELELTAGTWWKAAQVFGASGNTISELGRWTEPTRGTIDLTGFTTVAFSAPLEYSDAGAGVTAMTFPCPGVATEANLTPQLVFSRAP